MLRLWRAGRWMSVPGAPDELIALTTWTRIARNHRNGRVPRLFPAMLRRLGCVVVHTEASTVVVEHPDDGPCALPRWLRSWKRAGARLDNGFSFTLTYLLTHGLVAEPDPHGEAH